MLDWMEAGAPAQGRICAWLRCVTVPGPFLEMLEFSALQLQLQLRLRLHLPLAAGCLPGLVMSGILLHAQQTKQSTSILRVIIHELDKNSGPLCA